MTNTNSNTSTNVVVSLSELVQQERPTTEEEFVNFYRLYLDWYYGTTKRVMQEHDVLENGVYHYFSQEEKNKFDEWNRFVDECLATANVSKKRFNTIALELMVKRNTTAQKSL